MVSLNAHVFTLHLQCSGALHFTRCLGSLVVAGLTGLIQASQEG